MDWTHTFTIIGALGAFMLYISSRSDKRMDALESKLDHLNERLNSFENQTNQRLTAIETILSYSIPKKIKANS